MKHEIAGFAQIPALGAHAERTRFLLEVPHAIAGPLEALTGAILDLLRRG